jgi:hypothetical protein
MSWTRSSPDIGVEIGRGRANGSPEAEAARRRGRFGFRSIRGDFALGRRLVCAGGWARAPELGRVLPAGVGVG